MQTERPSRAKAFFDEVKSRNDPAIFLKDLVKAEIPAFESEFLEFKGARVLDIKSDNMSELWAKNLSAFANSDGGIVIFGIDAPDGQAKSLSLAPDVDALSHRLKELVRDITEPPVQRVEIQSYPETRGAKQGFVVCSIPPSPWRPHQIRVGKLKGQFYVRAADNCIPCNLSTLRALFAPQSVSVFAVYYRVQIPNHVDQKHIGAIECLLQNKGPATASEIFVTIDRRPATGLDFDWDKKLWDWNSAVPEGGVALTCKRPIHPRPKTFSPVH